MTRRLWIRADGSRSMGMGHIMRSLSIAQVAALRNTNTVFVSAEGDGLAYQILEARGVPVSRLSDASSLAWLEETNPGQDAVVFDGYHFGEREHSAARERGLRVGAIADFGVGHFAVDVLVDPNHEEVTGYTSDPSTILLAGPRYALVRQEFSAKRRERTGGRDRLLILTGSSDTGNILHRILDAVSKVDVFHQTMIVAGPGTTPDSDKLPGSNQVLHNPPDMAGLFDSADAAVSAAGSTTWELLCTGLPAALIQVADNQARVIRTARESGAALIVGGPEDIEDQLPEQIRKISSLEHQRLLSNNALKTVDGSGAQRIFEALCDRT